MYSLGCCRLLRRFWQIRICTQAGGQTSQGMKALVAADVAPDPHTGTAVSELHSLINSCWSSVVNCCWSGMAGVTQPCSLSLITVAAAASMASSWLQLGQAARAMCCCTAGTNSKSPSCTSNVHQLQRQHASMLQRKARYALLAD
jgi:hypothetical protein